MEPMECESAWAPTHASIPYPSPQHQLYATSPAPPRRGVLCRAASKDEGNILSQFFSGDLPKNTAILLALLVFSRLGVYIRLPGVDVDAFAASMQGGGLLGYIDTLSGGSISRVGVFSLGKWRWLAMVAGGSDGAPMAPCLVPYTHVLCTHVPHALCTQDPIHPRPTRPMHPRPMHPGPLFPLPALAGIVPYINASILLQLLATLSPSLKRLQREEGRAGRARFELYQKLASLGFAVAQAVGQLTYLRPYVPDFSLYWLASNSLVLTTGAMILVFVSRAGRLAGGGGLSACATGGGGSCG